MKKKEALKYYGNLLTYFCWKCMLTIPFADLEVTNDYRGLCPHCNKSVDVKLNIT